MSGLILHPGHHELHGVTVVIETVGGVTYVGRFDTAAERGVHLLNLAVHDPARSPVSREAFLDRMLRFGVKQDVKFLVIPHDEITNIRRLADLPG